jgi:phenylalanyl-tRNA synthetase beta chain
MKFSEQWLREWVNPAVSSNVLIEQLNMAGLEVESLTEVADNFSHVVVAEVLSVEQHPQADKLKVCQVNVGDAILQIVCGANNVKAGIKVPAALVGAVFPNNFVIKPVKLRGIESLGMLCSAKELGIATESEGLLILDDAAPVGASIRAYLDLDDLMIEVDLTPNRADCLSIAGMAQEVAVLNRIPLKKPLITPISSQTQVSIDISLEASMACPHYVGLMIENVDLSVSSPFWLTEKLRRSGIRSIDPIVDVTNYVMLELGQPLHAFDSEKICGNITVRYAKDQEKLLLLNGETIVLSSQDLVIADNEKVLAFAGIMGGLKSAVTEKTRSIFIESAYFSPTAVAGRARVYGLHTDASHRFERGVSPDLPLIAMYRAAALIQSIVGGQIGQLIEKTDADHYPHPKRIRLRYARIERLLGVVIDHKDVEDILTRLGMTLHEESAGIWEVIIPLGRFDLSIEEDLIEELARVYGYHRIPEKKPYLAWETIPRSEKKIPLRRFKEILVNRDYHEVITYSFVDPKLQTSLNLSEGMCILENPLSPELSVMRTSLWTGLLTAYLYNKNRQQHRLRFFETGLCFYQDNNGLHQKMKIGGLISGTFSQEQWGTTSRKVDFFDVKADVTALLKISHLDDKLEYVPLEVPSLHPGQCAKIYHKGHEIGVLGALHPKIRQELAIKEPVFLFELDLQSLDLTELPKFATLSKYPLIRRDLALVVKDSISAGDLMQCLRKTVGDMLVDLQLFDVYRGQGIPEGCKSLALGIYLQHIDKTLQDDEINQVMENILHTLKEVFDAKLRE